MIQTVHFRLQFEQQLGIAHVIAQPGRHYGPIFEQIGKHAAVGRHDRVLLIKHLKRCRTVIGVDDYLNAVPRVVNEIAVETVVAGVPVAV